MQLPLYQVDAFADAPFRGNPAAVCPLDAWLPDATLQAIAAENNLSETAFVVAEGDGYHLRWFTPTTEVALCGHATLATAYVLLHYRGAAGDRVDFSSKSGPLTAARDGELITLDFPTLPAEPCETPAALVEGLGKEPTHCLRARDLVAVYDSEADIRALAPDFARLRELEGEGVIATAPGEEADFVSRFFAPKQGIDEDPVTGSAHCTTAPYWAGRLGKRELSAVQLSKRTGRLRCVVEGDRVLISGKVAPYLVGTITIDEAPA